jgi:hypothetical protein
MLLLVTKGTYELCRSDALICHDMHAKFHTDWLVVEITERVNFTFIFQKERRIKPF